MNILKLWSNQSFLLSLRLLLLHKIQQPYLYTSQTLSLLVDDFLKFGNFLFYQHNLPVVELDRFFGCPLNKKSSSIFHQVHFLALDNQNPTFLRLLR